MPSFTPDELAAMAVADAEIDAAPLTREDYLLSAELDRAAKGQRLDNRQQERTAKKRAYREANREEYNTYMREYQRKRKEREAHHAPQNPGAANQKPDEGGGL